MMCGRKLRKIFNILKRLLIDFSPVIQYDWIITFTRVERTNEYTNHLYAYSPILNKDSKRCFHLHTAGLIR